MMTQDERVVRDFQGELKQNEKVHDVDAWPVARTGRGFGFLRGRCSSEERGQEEGQEEEVRYAARGRSLSLGFRFLNRAAPCSRALRGFVFSLLLFLSNPHR